MFNRRIKSPTQAARHPMFESLEGRQLFSVAPSVVTVHPNAILGPSAVEGKYKGSVTEKSGTAVPVKIVVTATKAELIINGTVTLTQSLTASQLKSIREGTFDVTFKLGKESVTCTGTESKGGAKISGKYKTSTSATGTFAVTKYA